LLLLVGSDAGSAAPLGTVLDHDGFECFPAYSREEALAQLEAVRPDAVLVDLDSLDGTASGLCREIRAQSAVPIVVLSRAPANNDAALADCLDQGADTLLLDPTDVALVRAQLRAQLRRVHEYAIRPRPGVILDRGRLRINVSGREVFLDGRLLRLSPKEFDLLTALAINEGRVMRSSELLKQVWGYDRCCRTRTLQTHVSRLRSQIEVASRNPQVIVTVTSVGYKFHRP
jgi:two-component system response regulator RegX3